MPKRRRSGPHTAARKIASRAARVGRQTARDPGCSDQLQLWGLAQVAWNDACCLARSCEPLDQSNGLYFRPKWTSRPPDPAFSGTPGPKKLDIQQVFPVGTPTDRRPSHDARASAAATARPPVLPQWRSPLATQRPAPQLDTRGRHPRPQPVRARGDGAPARPPRRRRRSMRPATRMRAPRETPLAVRGTSFPARDGACGLPIVAARGRAVNEQDAHAQRWRHGHEATCTRPLPYRCHVASDVADAGAAAAAKAPATVPAGAFAAVTGRNGRVPRGGAPP